MITEERIASFIQAHEKPKTPFLGELRKEAQASGIPIVKPETEALLSFLVELVRPKRILEVGTAVAYSAISMAVSMPEDGRIITLENYGPRISEARMNIEKSGFSDKIRLLPGDAGETLETLSGPFDFIFMDAAKGQYGVWLPAVLRLLRPGGVLISDNVMMDGEILESRYNVRRRDRTIHKRMRAYIRELKEREDLVTSILPVGDGVTVTVKRKKTPENRQEQQ